MFILKSIELVVYLHGGKMAKVLANIAEQVGRTPLAGERGRR
jgi:hypothetical protein